MMRSAWLDPVRTPARRMSLRVLAPLAVALIAFLALNVGIAGNLLLIMVGLLFAFLPDSFRMEALRAL